VSFGIVCRLEEMTSKQVKFSPVLLLQEYWFFLTGVNHF